MAIAFDAATPGSFVSSGTTLTIAHPTAAGSNRVIVVGVTWDNTGALTVSGVTYNGVALSSLTQSDTPFGAKSCQLWYLVAPATGTNNVVVTQSGTIVGMNAYAATFSGVAQTSTVGTVANGGDNTDPVTVSPGSTSDGVVVDAVYCQVPVTVGAGQTQMENVTGTWETAGSYEAGTGSPVVMSWTMGGGFLWASTAVNLNAAAAAAAAVNENRISLERPFNMTVSRGRM